MPIVKFMKNTYGFNTVIGQACDSSDSGSIYQPDGFGIFNLIDFEISTRQIFVAAVSSAWARFIDNDTDFACDFYIIVNWWGMFGGGAKWCS